MAIGLLAAMAPVSAQAQSLKQVDCSALKKQADGTYLALKDISIVDSDDNTFSVSKGATIGPHSMVSNGVSIHALLDKKCCGAAAAEAAPGDAALYVYVDAGRPGGPTTLSELENKVASGALSGDAVVWSPSLPQWMRASEVAGTAPAATNSCPGAGAAIYDDKFADASGGIEVVEGRAADVGGALQIDLTPKQSNWAAINTWRSQLDGDYCAEIAFPGVSGDTEISAGLAVLATDFNNFYLGQIAKNGVVALLRRAGGHWTNLKVVDDSSAVDRRPGAVNTVRIFAKNSVLTLYVNGVRIAEDRAEVPAAPHFGFYAQVEGSKPPADTPVRFKRLRIGRLALNPVGPGPSTP